MLLDFAAGSRQPEGFGYLLADGTVDASRGLETWINARMTHVFSLALLDGHDTESLVRHGIEALRGPLRDHRHGGWYRTTADSSKAAYEHAFVLLAGASAAAAGVDDRLVREALEVWDGRFWDDTAGAVVESYAEDWSGLEEYRGANSNMHGVEAMLAAADVLPDRAGDLRSRALRVVERFVHREAGSRDWRLPEHFDAAWQVDLGYNADRPADPFRPYGVTVGHQLEWARLAVHLAAVLGDAPGWLRRDADGLYVAAVDRGWAADGRGGDRDVVRTARRVPRGAVPAAREAARQGQPCRRSPSVSGGSSARRCARSGRRRGRRTPPARGCPRSASS